MPWGGASNAPRRLRERLWQCCDCHTAGMTTNAKPAHARAVATNTAKIKRESYDARVQTLRPAMRADLLL
eukprot:11185937-Lingulodinium_polyedra.AAC.1